MIWAAPRAHWVTGVRIICRVSTEPMVMCEWQSKTPGISHEPARSVAVASGSVRFGPIAVTTPSATATSTGSVNPPDSSSTRTSCSSQRSTWASSAFSAPVARVPSQVEDDTRSPSCS